MGKGSHVTFGRRLVAILLVCSFASGGRALADDEGAENTKALCTDREDNDGDGLVDCADPQCSAFLVCADQLRPDRADLVSGNCAEPRTEIASMPRTVLGAVLIPLGLIMIGGSIPLYMGINYSTSTFSGTLTNGSGTFTTQIGFGYSCSADRSCNTSEAAAHSRDVPYLAGGLILSVVGAAATSVGGWLLYTGLQPKKKKKKRTDLGFAPQLGASPQGFSVGLGGTF